MAVGALYRVNAYRDTGPRFLKVTSERPLVIVARHLTKKQSISKLISGVGIGFRDRENSGFPNYIPTSSSGGVCMKEAYRSEMVVICHCIIDV